MRKVAIIGIGQVPVREHWGKSLRELAVDALWQALEDANRNEIDGLVVGNMLSGTLSEQEHLGALIADFAGFPGVEAVKVEGACASGAAAFRQGLLAVASGQKLCGSSRRGKTDRTLRLAHDQRSGYRCGCRF